jgi:hypothetical protein
VSEFLEIANNPGVIAVASGLAAVATYSFQEHQKRKANQYKNMGALYENIISNLFRLFFVENGKERSALLNVIEKAWLYASDDVLMSCYNFLNTYDDGFKRYGDVVIGIKEDPEFKRRIESNIANLLANMRYDLRDKKQSTISLDWAVRNFEIYKWGAIWQREYPNGFDEIE